MATTITERLPRARQLAEIGAVLAKTCKLWVEDEIDDREMMLRLHRLTLLLMTEHDKYLDVMKEVVAGEQLSDEAEKFLQGVEGEQHA